MEIQSLLSRLTKEIRGGMYYKQDYFRAFLEAHILLWVSYVPALFANIPRDCFTSNTINYLNFEIF